MGAIPWSNVVALIALLVFAGLAIWCVTMGDRE